MKMSLVLKEVHMSPGQLLGVIGFGWFSATGTRKLTSTLKINLYIQPFIFC
jgi:hypothetical protein